MKKIICLSMLICTSFISQAAYIYCDGAKVKSEQFGAYDTPVGNEIEIDEEAKIVRKTINGVESSNVIKSLRVGVLEATGTVETRYNISEGSLYADYLFSHIKDDQIDVFTEINGMKYKFDNCDIQK